jgi:Fe-S-cluster containining protein
MGEFIEQILAAFPNADKRKVLADIMDGIEFYRSKASKYLNGPMEDRLGIVHAFYDAVHRSIKRDTAKTVLDQVKCKKGCAHCCKIRVLVSLAEAQYIYEYSKENNITIDVDYLKEQAKLTEDHDYDFSKFRNCVFLSNDNSCLVYEARPISCRRHLVVSEPSNCDVQGGKKTVSAVPALDASLIGAGLMVADKEHGNFPEMLLRAIELDKDNVHYSKQKP